ncbi:MAG: hypothetical protein LBR40_03040 [Bacilli bacterium]|jgi:hypothetical protein|nr:hypothetical protein [Bacilli bacterium]
MEATQQLSGIAAILSASPLILFAVLCAFLAFGDFLSTKTKAIIPAAFVFAVILMVTSWVGIIPHDIVQRIGFTDANSILLSLMTTVIVVNMGTQINIMDIVRNWKTVVIALAALLGVAALVLVVGSQIFGWQMAAVAAPPISGGFVAALLMSNAASQTNNELVIILPMLIYTIQQFFGMLSLPSVLKRVMKNDLKEKEANKEDLESLIKQHDTDREVKQLIPDKYMSVSTILMLLGLVSVLAYCTTEITRLFMGQYAISSTIFALIYGVLFTELGILPKNALQKANSMGMVMQILIFAGLASLAKTDPNQILSVLVPMLGLIICGVIGIFIFSVIVGKFAFKEKWDTSFSIGLNCLLGFPFNYLITLEAIKALTEDKKETAYLNAKYVPMMLVAGFTTVTIGSVIFAGILINFV